MQNQILSKKAKDTLSFWIFPVVLLIIAWFYNFDQILFLKPQSIHFWRQSDCLSFAQNYMMENRGLFHPSVNYIGMRGDGEVVSDFPLIYYLVGKLWQLFGQHEWIYRLLVFVLFLTGLTIFYQAVSKFIKSSFWAGIILLLLFSSPVIAYYSCNFLMNLPALSFALMGLSSFFYFYKTGKDRYLWLSCVAYLIGGLIKIPALITFVVICFVYITDVTGIIRYLPDRKIFSSKFLHAIPLLMIIICEILWIFYVNKYNVNNGGLFLVGIYPIWGLTHEEIKNIIDVFFETWFEQHFSRALHYTSLAMLVWVIINMKRLKPILKVFIVLVFIGVTLYIVFWFQALLHHDYYVTNTYIYFVIVWTIGLKILIDRVPKFMASPWSKILLIGFLIYNINYSRKEIDSRYNSWRNDSYKKYFEKLTDLKPELRNMGITRLDTVIVLGDETINGSLYLLDQKGWTNYGGYMNNMDSVKIDRAIQCGAKYMIMIDSAWAEKDFVKPFVQHQILQKDMYKVFLLK